MSVLINGLDMPKGCLGCPCINAKYNECMILQRRVTNVMTRMTDCPLIELPDHGDLIDRDALMKHKGSAYDIEGHELYAVGTGTILRMPAVIPAERSEDETG